jgi:alpha-ribazole phosphatase/probable phosphoglycerate mutase
MSRTHPAETRIDLLRHGEPVGGRRYRGQTDDPLSDKGWQQMRSAVAGLNEWDVVYTSPLKRCAEFAAELADKLALPLKADARLMEIGFGAWEGRTAEELRRDDPQRIERFWRDPVGNRPEGAEPIAGFHARVAAAWRDILASHAGERILVVGHAGITRMVLSLALGSPPEHMCRIQVDTAGLTRIRVRGHGAEALPILEFHGRTRC